MPLTAEDVLKKLTIATEEARATIREVHEARSAALDVVKKQRQQIADTIVKEIADQVEQLGTAAYAEMRARIDQVITRIETDWRAKLGLDT